MGCQSAVVRAGQQHTFVCIVLQYMFVMFCMSVSWCDVMQCVLVLEYNIRPRITNHYCKPNFVRHPAVSLRRVIHRSLHVACVHQFVMPLIINIIHFMQPLKVFSIVQSKKDKQYS